MADSPFKGTSARKIFTGNDSPIGEPIVAAQGSSNQVKKIPIYYKYIIGDTNNAEIIIALKEFLEAIAGTGFNPGRAVAVPPILKNLIRFGKSGEGANEEINISEFKIDTLARPSFVDSDLEKQAQKQKLYLDDIAQLLLQIRSIFESTTVFSINKEILKNNVFENVKLIRPLRPGSLPANFLASKINDLTTATNVLLDSLGDIEAEAAAEDTASLETPLLEDLRSTPERALTREIWDDYIFPLARDFQKATLREKSFAVDITSLDPKRVLVKQTRQAFHLFLEKLSEAIKNTSNLPGPNRGQEAYTFLKNETKEAEKLKNVNSQTFYFPPDIANNSDALESDDQRRITAFWQFFVTEGVMERILGRVELDKETKDQQIKEAEEETSGGEPTEEEVEEELKIGEFVSLEDFAKQHRAKVLKLVLNHPDLNLEAILDTYELTTEERNKIRNFVAQKIDQVLLPLHAWGNAMAQSPFFDKEKEGFTITAELLTRFEQIRKTEADNYIIDINAQYGSTIAFVEAAIEEFQALQAQESFEEEVDKLANNEEELSRGNIPDNLDEIVARYLAAQGETAPTPATLIATWQKLSIRERRELISNFSEDSLKWYVAIAQRLAAEQLGAQGFSEAQIEQILSDSQLSNQILNLILDLDYQQLSQLQTGPGRIALWSNLQLLTAQNPVVQAYIEAYIEAYTTPQNIILSDVDLSDVENWTADDVQKHLGIKIAPARLNSFKAYLGSLQPYQSQAQTTEQIGREKQELNRERERLQDILSVWFLLDRKTQAQVYKSLNLKVPGGSGPLDIPFGPPSISILSAMRATRAGRELLPEITEIAVPPPLPPEPTQPEEEPSPTATRVEKRVPGAPQPKKESLLQKASQARKNFQKLSLGAKLGVVAAQIFAYLLPMISSWVGLAGTVLGAFIGSAIPGVGTTVGALAGGWGGVAADQYFGIHKWLGRPIDLVLKPGGIASAASNLPPISLPTGTGAAPSYAAIETAKTAPLLATSTGAGLITVGGIAALSITASAMLMTAMLAPESEGIAQGELSKYVKIEKSSNPKHLENEADPTDVTYTITITPKDGYVIVPNIAKTTDEFSSFGEEAPPTPIAPIDDIKTQLLAAVGNEGSPLPEKGAKLSYTIAGVDGVDALLNNTFTLYFTVVGEDKEGEQKLRASNALSIGDPKLGCFNFVDSGHIPDGSGFTAKTWDESDKAMVKSIYLKRAGSSQAFNTLLCGGGQEINLFRATGPDNYGGFRFGDNIAIYDLGISTPNALEYTLVHELGHMVEGRNGSIRPEFSSIADGSCYTYPLKGNCNQSEAFAEAIALAVVHDFYLFPSKGNTRYPFNTLYPEEYCWVTRKIFDGYTFSSSGADPNGIDNIPSCEL